MTNWIRFRHRDQTGFGTLSGQEIVVHHGDMFDAPKASGARLSLSEVELLAPCVPSKIVALWNNFHALAAKQGGVISNPKGPDQTFYPSRAVPTSGERVIKGGSFLCHVDYCESYRPSARRGTPPDTGSGHVGFRCVKSSAAR